MIEDVEPEPFKFFLEFLYTGVSPDPTSTKAWDLLPLADRFGSESLKNMCEAILVGNLAATNAIKSLVLAHVHSCSILESKSLPIIKKNLKALIATDEWKQLEKFPKLSLRVAESFVE